MDLKSGTPFWPSRDGMPFSFPRLEQNVDCDIAIVGGGITGALIADKFAAAHFDVVVLDKRDIGWGSTAASTALLQYEIDTELQALARRYGIDRAVAAYRECEAALDSLEELSTGVDQSHYARSSSLYIASRPWHRRRLQAEGELRRQHGFEVEILGASALRERYEIRASLGLLTAHAGRVDPYRLTHGLLHRLSAKTAHVYDRTEVRHWQVSPHGVALSVQDGWRVRCRYLIIAAGYESQQYLSARLARNHSSYAFASEPAKNEMRWLGDTLFWESARPYLYLRSTVDGRVIVGGEDDRVDIPAKRDAALPHKVRALVHKLHKRMPWLCVEPTFAWAGTFAETSDGLPYFGFHPQHGPRVLFALAYGGNGIVFSCIGADILLAHVRGERHVLRDFFSFDRTGHGAKSRRGTDLPINANES